MPVQALDSKGLVKPGYPLLIYLPAYDGVIPLLVKARLNEGYETFEYGPLPDCGTAISNGVISAGGLATGCTFSYRELPPEDRADMFYFTDSDMLLHVHAYIRPLMLRILLEIPQGSRSYSFRRLIPQAATRDFGWFRYYREIVFPPRIHVGWDFYNPTNMSLRTHARFIYGEYIVEPLLDTDVLAKIFAGKAPAHTVVFGGMQRMNEIERAAQIWGAAIVPKPPAYMTGEDEIRGFLREYLGR